MKVDDSGSSVEPVVFDTSPPPAINDVESDDENETSMQSVTTISRLTSPQPAKVDDSGSSVVDTSPSQAIVEPPPHTLGTDENLLDDALEEILSMYLTFFVIYN